VTGPHPRANANNSYRGAQRCASRFDPTCGAFSPPGATGLRFFHPRLNPGGLLISDDYRWAPGVRKAFETYFDDARPDPIIELAGSQALVVKIGG
jgi:hypothetical protein